MPEQRRNLMISLRKPSLLPCGLQPSRACTFLGTRRGRECRTSPALYLTAARYSLCLVFACATYVHAVHADETEAVNTLMTNLYERGQFNGSIIVARDGKVIYRNAFGEANSKSHQKFTPTTPSCLASVSKQFTSMLIMMLSEQGKINYDDPVSKYIPKLAKCVDGITVRHLLTHTSGIPDVGDLDIDHPGLTESDVMKAIIKQHSQFPKPGLRYQYSNTGYILLAMIVEQVTGKSFSDCLRDDIFNPLGMNSTFLDDGSGHNLNLAATGYDQYGNIDGSPPLAADFPLLRHLLPDYTKGDGGIYSTVDDLLKWDEALYTNKLVRQSTLEEAFTPGEVKEGISTYGFGWNISRKYLLFGDKYVWHTGNTGGYRAFIGRRLGEKITVIMLTNKGNSPRVEINDAIVNILHGKAYDLPKLPMAAKMYDAIMKQGIEAALQMYNSLKASNGASYEFSESEFNALGYKLLDGGDKGTAIRIFELNTAQYPSSSNAFDSLAEAYQKAGKKDLAIKACKRAVELDKNNLHARNMLRKLE
jgi:CubicO group peptidase (beta-lactamase class C family)